MRGCHWVSPHPSLFRWNKPGSLSLSLQGKCSSSQPSWGPSAKLTAVYLCLSWIEGPKLDTVFKMLSNKGWAVKDSHFPQTTGYAPGKSDPPCIRRQPKILLFSAMRNAYQHYQTSKVPLKMPRFRAQLNGWAAVDVGGLWKRLQSRFASSGGPKRYGHNSKSM